MAVTSEVAYVGGEWNIEMTERVETVEFNYKPHV
jgi:hypothetical protein